MLRLWINRSISYADKTRELSLSSVCPMLLIFEALLSDVSEWFNEFPEKWFELPILKRVEDVLWLENRVLDVIVALRW